MTIGERRALEIELLRLEGQSAALGAVIDRLKFGPQHIKQVVFTKSRCPHGKSVRDIYQRGRGW